MNSLAKGTFAALVMAAGLLAMPDRANAAVLSFGCISANAGCSVENQLSVTVTGGTFLGINYVDFLFSNTGPTTSSITDIYFDESSTPELGFGVPNLAPTSAGVTFTYPALVLGEPGDLPGGAGVGFSDTDRFHSAGTFTFDPSVYAAARIANGVNLGEQLRISFALGLFGVGPDYQAIIANMFTPGGLRIGLNVRGIDGGRTPDAQFVNTVVPEPASMLLLGTGLAGIAAAARRRRRPAKSR